MKLGQSMRVWMMVTGLALLLAACGGGGGPVGAANGTPPAQAAFAAGEPSPNGTAPVVADFIAMAKGAACAGQRNDLYVIDSRQVLWDRAGQCPDNAYQQMLFGATPGQVLCSVADSIAGPRVSCQDETARPQFESLLRNLNQPNLGLAASHKVDKVSLAVPAGMTVLARDDFAAVLQPRTVVVEDATALAQLWAEIYADRAALPAVPVVDFSRQMVVGVFAGRQPAGCRLLDIVRAAPAPAGLDVGYAVTTLETFAPCAQSSSTPGALVALARSGGAVRFIDLSPPH